jgi:hypothetical protein
VKKSAAQTYLEEYEAVAKAERITLEEFFRKYPEKYRDYVWLVREGL